MPSSADAPAESPVLADQIKAILPECIDLRRKIHASPELSLKEEGTAKSIFQFLTKQGMKTRSYGFPSVVCDTGPNPTIAIRADMDALPIQEASGEEFSSRNQGVMHACGHDAHSAILACAGALLFKRKIGSVRLIFQPAEEIGRGAVMMINEGVLDGIERIFGLHVWPSLDSGTIAVLQGPAMAANALFTASLGGTGGHGAYPHLAQDTVTASASFIMNANTIVSRTVDPLDSAVVSFGQIGGGTAANVIPSEIVLKGTIRSFDPSTQGRLKATIERMLRDAASSYGLAHSIEWFSEGPAVINDSEFAGSCAQAISQEVRVVGCNPTMGSEDFAYYLQKVKGAFAFLGTGGREDTRRSKHSSNFKLDESSLNYGIAAEVLVGEKL